MESRGYKLTITEKPANTETNIGKLFTASYEWLNEKFETTEEDENVAVCLAALKAYGSPLQ